MPHKRWPLVGIVGALLFSAQVTSAGQSATTAKTSALASSAEIIALAQCDRGESAWSGDPPIIVTRYQCHVERAFKGSSAGTVTVQLLGGNVDGMAMQASTGPTLAPDADVILLLRPSAFGAYHVVVGGEGGVLPVAGSSPERTVLGMSLDEFGRLVSR